MMERLTNFLEQFTKYAHYRVNIQTLATDYTARTGKKAKIVVPFPSCIILWYNFESILHLYDVQELIVRIRKFVESFKKLNVELVFLFNGLNMEEDKAWWLSIYRKAMTDIKKDIKNILRKTPNTDRTPVLFNSALFPDPDVSVAYILKYVLGCEVHMMTNGEQKYIAKYAQDNDCIAIFSHNPNFVASQVDAIVLSPRSFLIEDMTVCVYDRVKLAHKLGIRTDELPLLAVLLGNETFPNFKEITQFHRRLCPAKGSEIPIQMLIPAIAGYVNKLPKEEDIDERMRRLSLDIYNDASYVHVELLKNIYNTYFFAKNSDASTNGNSNSSASSVPTSGDEWSKILHVARDRFWNALLPDYAYTVMTGQIFVSGMSYEDLTFARYHQPSCKVLQPLRERLYGILLFEKNRNDPSAPPVTVQEWCNESDDSFLQPVIVKPYKTRVHHPGLMALWSDDDNLNDERWRLFLSTICWNWDVQLWQSLDDYILSVLSACYLYGKAYLLRPELDAVLLTIATSPLYDADKLSSMKFRKYRLRPAAIIIAMKQAFKHVLTVLAACGYPVKLSENNAYLKFEVKVFQIKYAALLQKKKPVESLCNNNDDCLKLYKRMKDIIIHAEIA